MTEQPDTDRPLVRITGDGIGRVWVPSTAAGGMSSIPPTAYEPVRPVGTPEPPSDPEEACPEFTHIGYCPYQECENGCKHAGDDDRPQDAQELHRLIEVGPVDLDVLGDAARTAFYAPPCVAWVDLDPPDRAAWMAVAAAVLAALPSGAAKEDR